MAAEEAAIRVVVIDDDLVTRRLLQLHLSALGCESIAAGDGATGVALAVRERPDAVLLDIQLPDIDGLQACRQLRAHPATASIPVLLVTAMSNAETRIAGFEAGADDYLPKPFEARELAARLRAHVNLARQRQRVASLEAVLGTVRMISHEFNNPLQVVVGGLQLMTAEEPALADRGEEGLQMLREAVTELVELTRRLHAVSDAVFKPTPMGEMLDLHASTNPE
jgi:DNA-binding response OmpR family regulator